MFYSNESETSVALEFLNDEQREKFDEQIKTFDMEKIDQFQGIVDKLTENAEAFENYKSDPKAFFRKQGIESNGIFRPYPPPDVQEETKKKFRCPKGTHQTVITMVKLKVAGWHCELIDTFGKGRDADLGLKYFCFPILEEVNRYWVIKCVKDVYL